MKKHEHAWILLSLYRSTLKGTPVFNEQKQLVQYGTRYSCKGNPNSCDAKIEWLANNTISEIKMLTATRFRFVLLTQTTERWQTWVGFLQAHRVSSSSVADPGCLSRIRIFHPGSRILGRKDPGSGAATKNLSTVCLTYESVPKLSEIW